MIKGISKKRVIIGGCVITIEHADLGRPLHRSAMRKLLAEYMEDPMGGKLPRHTNAEHRRMIQGLSCMPTAIILIAFCKNVPIGMTVCFTGFSTFKAAPLINIHDIIVTKSFRGKGIGKKLLLEIQELALSTGCCKVTLEVRKDNVIAKSLYKKAGFSKGTVAMEFLTKTADPVILK